MTLRQYLILMSIGTISCWVAWFFVITSLDPNKAGMIGFLFFYISLFLALVGTFSVIGFMVRRKILKDDELVFRHVKKTFRQGILFASLILIVLFLLQMQILTWWVAILLAVLYAILEGIIFTNRKYNNNDYVPKFNK